MWQITARERPVLVPMLGSATMGAPRASWLLAAVASSAITSSGCFTYLIGSKSFDHDASVKTGAILTGSELAGGAVAGVVIFGLGDPRQRLSLGGSMAAGIGLTLLADLVVGSLVGLVGCVGNEKCE
jgi:hypothetical protein